jgi:hypothetical protein
MPKRKSIRRMCEIHQIEKTRIRRSVGKWRFVCLECIKKYSNHPSKRAWDKANKAKKAVHKIVESALLRGDLVRQPCCRCGSTDSHAHHDDYDKPLEVMWLCPLHHKERHREIE